MIPRDVAPTDAFWLVSTCAPSEIVISPPPSAPTVKKEQVRLESLPEMDTLPRSLATVPMAISPLIWTSPPSVTINSDGTIWLLILTPPGAPVILQLALWPPDSPCTSNFPKR